MIRVNLALMEAVNAQRAAERRGRPALHPMAEYYGDCERERERKPADKNDRSFVVNMNGDD